MTNKNVMSVFAIVAVAAMMVIGTVSLNFADVFAEKKDMVTICHNPNTLRQTTMEVAEKAVRGHLIHHDVLASCDALRVSESGVAQLFNGIDPFDLESSAITFTPVDSTYIFEVADSVASFPEVPGAGTTTETLVLADEDFVEKTIPNTSFFGTEYTSFFIGSNGFVTFVSGDTDFSESLNEFLTQEPRIAMLWVDLTPNSGGTVTFDEYSDRVVVTFEDVPEFALGGANSFQLVLNTNGVITMTYLNVSATDGLVGISSGFNSEQTVDFK